MGDEGIRALARRVVVEEDTTAEAEYPENWGAKVKIATHDGRRVGARVRHPRGTRENPCTDDDLRAKFKANVTPVLGDWAAAELQARIDAIGSLSDLSPIARLATSRETGTGRPVASVR